MSKQLGTHQPTKLVRIDRRNILGRTVTHCIPFNGLNREIITGANLVLGSSGSIKADQDGLMLQSTGAAAAASVAIDLSAYTKLTLCFSLLWDAFADNDSLAIEYGNDFASNSGFLIDPNSGAPFSGEFQIGVGSPGLANAASFSRPQAGKMLRYAIHFDRTTGVSNGCSAYINGIAQSMTPYASNNDVVDNFGNNILYFFSRAGTSLFGAGRLQNLVIHGGVLLDSKLIVEDYENPWQIFKLRNRILYSIPASSTTHVTSGGLVSGSALTNGSSNHVVPGATHSTSGTLQAQAAHVTGSASNFTVHASSGTLQAQVAGIVGSASNFTVHSSVGVLQTQGALVSGNADHVVSGTTHVTSGSLVSGQSSVSGVSQHKAKHITSGTLQSGSAVVSGVSQHKAKHNSSGALLAGSSIIVGSAAKSFGTTLTQASCVYPLYPTYEAQIDNILIYPQKCSYPGLSQSGGARFIEYWIME